MNTAERIRLEKAEHPERFCPSCLWRVQTRDGWNPCPKHPAVIPAVRTICAWCGGQIHDGALINGNESHGICPSCSEKYFGEAPRGSAA